MPTVIASEARSRRRRNITMKSIRDAARAAPIIKGVSAHS